MDKKVDNLNRPESESSSHYNLHLMAGLRGRRIGGRRRTYITIFKRAWSANFKMVWYVLLRALRPKLDGRDQVQIIVTRALNCSH
jgi:hypothetical protein